MITDERMEKLIKELFIEEIEEIEVNTDIEKLLDNAYEKAEKIKKIMIPGRCRFSDELTRSSRVKNVRERGKLCSFFISGELFGALMYLYK